MSQERTNASGRAAQDGAQRGNAPASLVDNALANRIVVFRLLTALAAVALIFATWPLWWPLRDFPQVPLVAWARSVSLSTDMTCATLLLFSLGAAIAMERRALWRGRADGPRELTTILWAATGALLVTLMALSQHRIQAWAYQFLLLSIVFVNCRVPRTWTLTRWIFASIYIHSALGKFDYSFQHTLGTQFIQGGLKMLPAALATLRPPEEWLPQLALVFPTTELLVGALLLCRSDRLRRAGVVLSVGMHVALLTILGPWGLSHHLGVLIWNSYFILTVPIIFWPHSPAIPEGISEQPSTAGPEHKNGVSFQATSATAIVLICLVLPFGNRAGVWDHWPSWGLYSPSNPRTLFWIAAPAAQRLPASLRAHLRTTDDPLWRRMSLSSLSLERVGAPLYPQDRFQLGVALQLARRLEIQRGCRFGIQSSADRWTGERVMEVGTYEQALGWAARFRLNALPRSLEAGVRRSASRGSTGQVASSTNQTP